MMERHRIKLEDGREMLIKIGDIVVNGEAFRDAVIITDPDGIERFRGHGLKNVACHLAMMIGATSSVENDVRALLQRPQSLETKGDKR
jgi:hypothetical protein